MAIFPPGNRPPGRRPALRGVLLQDLFRGVERTRSWPSKGPRRPTKAQLEARELFRQRVNATKYMPAAQQAQYREACEGTSFLPRDFLLMQMYGRLFAGVLPDGKVMYSMASRQTLSESLDILAQVPGMLLLRGEQYWEGFPMGAALQQLRVNAAGDALEWASPSAIVPTISQATIAGVLNTHSSGWGRVPINSVVDDPNGWWNAGQNGFQPTEPGFYQISIRARTNSSSMNAIAIGKNGSIFQAIGADNGAPAFALGGSATIEMNGTTDVVQAYLFSNLIRQYTTGLFDTYLQVTGPI